MITAQGSLTVVGANTANPTVYWNGQEIATTGIQIMNEDGVAKVTIKVPETGIYTEMKAAGIRVVREDV